MLVGSRSEDAGVFTWANWNRAGRSLRYTCCMPQKKRPAKDKPLKDFLKLGGRNNAEADFNSILKKAVKPKPGKRKANN